MPHGGGAYTFGREEPGGPSRQGLGGIPFGGMVRVCAVLIAFTLATGQALAQTLDGDVFSYGGGFVSSLGQGDHSKDAMTSLRLQGSQATFFTEDTYKCAHRSFLNVGVRGRGSVTGRSFSAAGTAIVHFGRGRVLHVSARLTGAFDARFSAAGTLHRTAVLYTGRRRRTCARHTDSPVHLSLTAGENSPTSRVRPGLVVGETGGLIDSTQLDAPIALRVDRHRRIGWLWVAQALCPWGRDFPFENFSPAIHIRRNGSFVSRERFTIKGRASTVYHTLLEGFFTRFGAEGDLRLKETWITPHGRVFAHCDTSPIFWSATYAR